MLRQFRGSSPTTAVGGPRTPMRRRIPALGLAVALALPLAACSDDGFTLPSGDDLKRFVSEAQTQIDTIGSDVAELAGQLGDLPDSVRSTAQDALDKSKEATARAQSALDDARNAKDGAQDSLENAHNDLEDAKTRISAALEQLKGKTDAESEKARNGLESLRSELDALQDDVAP